MIQIGYGFTLDFSHFQQVVFEGASIKIGDSSRNRLLGLRKFIEHLLKNNIKIYGLTTGFADLRNLSVSPHEANLLSKNLIHSHDAGIGESLDKDVVLGAMLIRTHSLAQGNSGFTQEGLQVLVDMINARIIPEIPSSGSLGASGDLAFLARLGCAMMGDPVPVYYKGDRTTADIALKSEGIPYFYPKAKEGLALTNGTSFMASMMTIAYLKELHILENVLAMMGLFLNAAQVTDNAFADSIHKARGQLQQINVASLLRMHLTNSRFIDNTIVQNDYCIRCLPQILGAKFEAILSQRDAIIKEMNAITDNPLIFLNEEISADIPDSSIFYYNGNRYAVLSGGNFHGEYSTTQADTIATANAKIAITLERQLAYILNPHRNDKLPIYLIASQKKAGLQSGFMITQYTANALVQKICHLAIPSSIFNITSANEVEDVVSYGASSAEKLLRQLDLFQQLTIVYLTTMLQAYAIVRKDSQNSSLSEQIFLEAQKEIQFPLLDDHSFREIYPKIENLLAKNILRKLTSFPLSKDIAQELIYGNL